MIGRGARRGGDEPIPIASSLDDVRADLGLPAADGYAALEAAWPELVGADVAQHARLSGVRAGALLVVVDHPAWATQLRYLEDVIVGRARAVLGEDAVVSLRWRVEP